MKLIWLVLSACAILTSLDAAEGEKIRTLAKGTFGGFQERTNLIVTNSTQWAEVWKKHLAQQRPEKPAPEVDFEKETVLLASLGRKNSGGYSVEILDVRRREGKTEVVLKVHNPKPGGIQLQALTAPFHIVAVPKFDPPVVFRTDP